MKLNQKLKILLIILIIILISIVGFVGIYVQNKNAIDNILPEYLLSMELKGYRKIQLKMKTETIKYDAEGNEIDETDTETEVARTEEKNLNDDSVKTSENYKKTKEIIKQRLEKLNVQEYYIRQGENSETIIIQIPEDSKTDEIVGQLELLGKFEIVDNETNEVLMTNDDIEKVQVGYGSTTYGTSVFLNIQFNKEGKEKFKNITNTYTKIEETADEVQEENNEVVTEEVEATEQTEKENVAKEIAIKIDDSTLLTTYFDEEISNGILQLSVGSSTDNTSEDLQEYYEQGNKMAVLLDTGKMPIIYEVNQNKYVQTDITNEEITFAVSIGIGLLTILIIIMIIKNKGKGILAAVSLVGYIAFLLITMRYTNVIISIEGLAAIATSILLEYIFLLNILKNKQDKFWKVYTKYIWLLIPILIIAVTFSLTQTTSISSFGMVIFWGIVVEFIWNAIITKNILNIKK